MEFEESKDGEEIREERRCEVRIPAERSEMKRTQRRNERREDTRRWRGGGTMITMFPSCHSCCLCSPGRTSIIEYFPRYGSGSGLGEGTIFAHMHQATNTTRTN